MFISPLGGSATRHNLRLWMALVTVAVRSGPEENMLFDRDGMLFPPFWLSLCQLGTSERGYNRPRREGGGGL